MTKSNQEQFIIDKNQEAARLRSVAEQLEIELLTTPIEDGELPPDTIRYRILMQHDRELAELGAKLEGADFRPAFLQWWESMNVNFRRSLALLPFLLLIEGLNLIRLNIHMTHRPDVEYESTSIIEGIVTAVFGFLGG